MVHDDDKHYFIPAKLLVQLDLIGDTRTIQGPNFTATQYPQFLINF